MSDLQRVVWTEGLFLQPQHFQQQQRHFEHFVQARSSVLQAYPWGFIELELDMPALGLGKVAFTSIRGVLPDGTPIDAPRVDPLPKALDFPGGRKDKLVAIALATRRSGVHETDLGDAQDPAMTRYSVSSAEYRDTSLPAEKTAFLQTGLLNLRIAIEEDVAQAYQTLGAVKVIERKADNSLVIDKSFIPPWLDCASHERLSGFAREVQAMLHQRGEALASRLGKAGTGGVAEIADFLMLQSVNRYEPLFEHAARLKGMHPEGLFRLCLEVCGDLAVFSSSGSRRVKPLPEYLHHSLATCFGGVMAELRGLLSMVLDQRALAIELVDRKYGVRTASVADLELLRMANFVLAVNASVPAEQLRVRFPTQTKIGPVERIRDLVNLQLPGIGLRSLGVAPREIPYSAGFHYYELDKSGDLWDQLAKTGNLAMHIAGDFPGLELQFWAIKQG